MFNLEFNKSNSLLMVMAVVMMLLFTSESFAVKVDVDGLYGLPDNQKNMINEYLSQHREAGEQIEKYKAQQLQELEDIQELKQQQLRNTMRSEELKMLAEQSNSYATSMASAFSTVREQLNWKDDQSFANSRAGAAVAFVLSIIYFDGTFKATLFSIIWFIFFSILFLKSLKIARNDSRFLNVAVLIMLGVTWILGTIMMYQYL